MESAEASREQRYNFELPRGASLRLNPDGSVGIVTRQGRNGESGLGGIEVPWAVDAAGRSLPSRFMIDGNTLIQITDVDASTAYPVVADPKMRFYFYDCGIVTCTRWVDVDITKYVYDRRGDETILYWGVIMGAACAVVSIFGAGTPCALIGALLVYDLQVNLRQAAERGHCLKIKYSRQLGFAVPVDYDDTDPSSRKCYRT